VRLEGRNLTGSVSYVTWDTMNAMTIKVVARIAGGVLLVILFVVLLTFIFSFLGTIMCAVLVGMMLGATRLGRWPTFALSLIFPAVIFAMLYLSKAELPGRKIAIISLVCFVAFWLTYVAAVVLFSCERKPAASASNSAPQRVEGKATEQPAATASASSLPRECSDPPLAGITLDVLQGTWLCSGGVNGENRKKAMAIESGVLTVSLADQQGGLNVIGRAQIQLETLDSHPTVSLLSDELSSDNLISI